MSLKKILLIVSLIAFCSCANWALLVAGSNTWYNYRHQADVYHAYHMLVSKGFQKQKIVTLAYDDIANNTKNPFKGKVFNKPSYKQPGQDVYAGVYIDYKGDDVSPQLFLNVLSGNKLSVNGKGSGRVLQSTQQDNIFIFFSDHGSPNLIAFPNQYLYADQLLETFQSMKGKYNKIVFYLQACQSGSMFTNLPKDTGIYAISAANPTESSWGTYCSPDDVIQGKHIGTCLGDLFSVNFIQHSQKNDLSTVTLQQQFQFIRLATQQSHVMQWGDLSFSSDKVSNYIAQNHKNVINFRTPIKYLRSMIKKYAKIDSRLMKIKILMDVHKRQESSQSQFQLKQQMKDMQRIDDIFFVVQKQLKLTGQYSPRHMKYQCMRTVMDYHTQKCGRLSDYGLKFAKYYAQACQSYESSLITSKIIC